jgi:excinuclease ABC subunit A
MTDAITPAAPPGAPPPTNGAPRASPGGSDGRQARGDVPAADPGGVAPAGPADRLIVRGAREHNLKDLHVEMPRHRLVVITGLSGSGKSSLAFDTIYAEGQRRYVESLSAYARQFLGLMEKPDVDAIEGLSPAIAIEQKTAARNPRSTVGTVTEVYDYLRLLYARVGVPHCHNCGRPITRQTVSQMVDLVAGWPEGTKLLVLAPLVRGRKGEYREVFEEARREGFLRVRVDGRVYALDEAPKLAKTRKHSIEVVVDRLVSGPESARRLADSLETAVRLGGGAAIVHRMRAGEEGEDVFLSQELACVACGISYAELEPRMFSFNSPYGACPACGGLGTRLEVDPDRVIADDRISLLEGVVLPWGEPRGHLAHTVIPALAARYGFDPNTPWGRLPAEVRRALLHGSGGEEIEFRYHGRRFAGSYKAPWEGILANLQKRHEDTASAHVRQASRPTWRCCRAASAAGAGSAARASPCAWADGTSPRPSRSPCARLSRSSPASASGPASARSPGRSSRRCRSGSASSWTWAWST